MKALARLDEAKKWSHFVKTASQKYGKEPQHPGLGYLLEKLRTNRYGVPHDLHETMQQRLNEKIMSGSGAFGEAPEHNTTKRAAHTIDAIRSTKKKGAA
jgi:hypothetical protein